MFVKLLAKLNSKIAYPLSCILAGVCVTLIVKMKIYFSTLSLVQSFQIQDEISAGDLEVLRQAMMRFLDNHPPYLVIDLSHAHLQVPDADLQTLILELKTLAQSKNISLVVAQSDIEARFAHQQVIENSLQKQAKILESKIELREKTRQEALRMSLENEKLKNELIQKQSQNESETISNHRFAPFIDKLWSHHK